MFDKLCRATRLWRDVDSKVALNLCQTQCIHYDNDPSGLVGLYPGSTFHLVLSGTTNLNLIDVCTNSRSTVELKYNLSSTF